MTVDLMQAMIACEMMEDEAAYLLNHDENVNHVVLIENDCSERVQKKLWMRVTLIPLEAVGPDSILDADMVLDIQPMALHETPEKLKSALREELEALHEACDEFMLLFGLCGNALEDIDEVRPHNSRVVILTDEEGTLDDCICLALGGRDEYLQALKENPGTFFMTRMWAENWKEMFHKCQILEDPDDIQGCKYLFDCVGYRKVVKMVTPFDVPPEELERHCRVFADDFELNYETWICDSSHVLLMDNYRRFRGT